MLKVLGYVIVISLFISKYLQTISKALFSRSLSLKAKLDKLALSPWNLMSRKSKILIPLLCEVLKL